MNPDLDPDARVFRFQYTVFAVDARIVSRRIEVRAGVRTHAAPLERLQHLHVYEDANRGVSELLISFAAPGGRLKRIRVFSDVGEPAFQGFVDAVLAERPEIDIRHLDRSAAWARMGSKEKDITVMAVLMGAAIVAMTVMFLPMLIHGLDRGAAEVPVEVLERGERPETRNVTVQGRPLTDRLVLAEVSTEPPPDSVTGWIPLVGQAWTPEQPVRVVLEIRGKGPDELLATGERTVFKGMIRDVLWEGLSDRRRRALVERGVLLDGEVLVIDVGAEPDHDLALALTILGLMAMILVGSIFVVRRRQRSGIGDQTRPPLNRPRQRLDDRDDLDED